MILAHIVEDRDTRLSRSCLGLWDNFRKFMTKTICQTTGSDGDLRSAGDPSPARSGFVRAGALRPDLVFVISSQTNDPMT